MSIIVQGSDEYDAFGKYSGRADISEIYIGNKRIKSVYQDHNTIFSAEDIIKVCDLDGTLRDLVSVDNYIYATRYNGNMVSSTFTGIIKIDRRKGTVTELDPSSSVTKAFGSQWMYNVCTNGSLILFQNLYNKYAWYNIDTNTFSEVYTSISSSAKCTCCIDDTYSYFAYENTILRINNSTKETNTFTHNISVPRRMESDSKYIYIIDSDMICYIFDKGTLSLKNTINPPDGVKYGTVSNTKTHRMCHNERYIFQFCVYNNDSYNRILVIDKINQTSILLNAISEMPNDDVNYSAMMTCSDDYLFVSLYTNVFIYNLSQNLTSYSIVNISKYRNGASSGYVMMTFDSYKKNVLLAFDGRVYKKHHGMLYLSTIDFPEDDGPTAEPY